MLSALIVLAVAGATPPPMAHFVAIAHPWFRSLPSPLPAGGYFELQNTGRWNAILTSVESTACRMLMMHKSELKDGTSHMTDVSSVEILAGQTVRFSPGSYHLMCSEPSATMRAGKSVSVTFRFSDGSSAPVPFAVKSPSGR